MKYTPSKNVILSNLTGDIDCSDINNYIRSMKLLDQRHSRKLEQTYSPTESPTQGIQSDRCRKVLKKDY